MKRQCIKMSFFSKDEDLNKPVRTFNYLKKGEGRKAHERNKGKNFVYLKKGEGKLASSNHGVTKFAEKRKQQIIDEQEQREKEYWANVNNDNKDDE
jgi:hypothetical protein